MLAAGSDQPSVPRGEGQHQLVIQRINRALCGLLASCAPVGQGELSRKGDDVPRFFPRGWLWPPQREQPLSLRKLPEVELGTAKMRLRSEERRVGKEDRAR